MLPTWQQTLSLSVSIYLIFLPPLLSCCSSENISAAKHIDLSRFLVTLFSFFYLFIFPFATCAKRVNSALSKKERDCRAFQCIPRGAEKQKKKQSLCSKCVRVGKYLDSKCFDSSRNDYFSHTSVRQCKTRCKFNDRVVWGYSRISLLSILHLR